MKIFTRYYYDCLQLTSFLQFDLTERSDENLSYKDFYSIKLQEQKEFQDRCRSELDNANWEKVHMELSEKLDAHRIDFSEYNPEIFNRWFDEPPEKIVDFNYETTYERLTTLLPDDIRNKVSDMRILALGFADKQLIIVLQKWAQSIKDYWHESWSKYHLYLKELQEKLPLEAKAFSKYSMHDQIVLEFIREDTCIKIKYYENVWGKAFLQLEEVESFEAKGDNLSFWLYDEIYLLPDGKLELHVLTSEGEFQVKCSDVIMTYTDEDFLNELIQQYTAPRDFYIKLKEVINSKAHHIPYDKLTEWEKGFLDVESIIESLYGTYLTPKGTPRLHKGFDQYFAFHKTDKALEFLNKLGDKRFSKIIEEAYANRENKKVLSNLSRRLKYAVKNYMDELYILVYNDLKQRIG